MLEEELYIHAHYWNDSNKEIFKGILQYWINNENRSLWNQIFIITEPENLYYYMRNENADNMGKEAIEMSRMAIIRPLLVRISWMAKEVRTQH